jgi:hypothetical protein
MSLAVIALLFTAGASTWLYTKLQRYSGNNTRQSIIATGVIAVVMFVLVFSVLNLIF